VNDEQPLRKIALEMDELCAALDDASYEHRYFLDTETGEVIMVSEMSDAEEVQQQLAEIDDAEPGRYLEVPPADSHEAYRDMEDFIVTVPDKRLQDLLDVAIQGRGAFRRFKDVLTRDPAERQRWFDFQASRLKARAREWLAEEGCEPLTLSARE
jgi:hypothetical protein